MSKKSERREKYGLDGWIKEADLTALQLEENDKNRDWQERMFQQYQSPQAQVNMRLAAGLNPTEGVTSQSVGTASTQPISGRSTADTAMSVMGALKDIPAAILGIAQQKANISNLNADTKKKQQEAQTEENRTRTEWFNSVIAETTAENLPAKIQSELKVLQSQIDKGGAEAEEAKLRYEMLKEYRDSGGNTFADEGALKQSEAFKNNVSAIRTQMLSLPQKQRIESETKLNNLAYELDDTYGRRIKSAMAQSSESELEKLKIDLREYIANSPIRRELVSIGLDDAKASLLEKQLSNAIDSIDLNTIRSIVGDGSDPRSLFYGIFKEFFADMP